MKAVVWHGVGDIRLDNVPEPKIQEESDAIVRLTASAICGTDLHFIRGTMPGMVPGTILGHEGVGVVEAVGKEVRNFRPGDRVVLPSTLGCGKCPYCRSGYYAQCDTANPNGPSAGTAFYGGPKDTGPFQGLQAEYARVPFANINLVKLPDEVSDDEAILLSDIFPTGYFGADMAGIKPGHNVCVWGCGPVGQFAIASAILMGAGRVFAVDAIPGRLEMARAQGAETINFDEEDPTEVLQSLTGGSGPNCAIDAVGVDAYHAHTGPAAEKAKEQESEFAEQQKKIAPKQNPHDGQWYPGNAPSQVNQWSVKSVAKAGTVSIIGVYPPNDQFFPIGAAMNKNLRINMGNCNHRKYLPHLVEMVRINKIEPLEILTQMEPISGAIEAYQAFDQRRPGWIKVELNPKN